MLVPWPAGMSRGSLLCVKIHLAAPPQVLALRQENERLKADLAGLLNGPLNKQLRLPPTLLLR